MARRAARPALVLVVALLAASAFVTLRWDGAAQHDLTPRAVVATEHSVVASGRSPRGFGLLLAVTVTLALPALGIRRLRARPVTRSRPRPALLRAVVSRGPPRPSLIAP